MEIQRISNSPIETSTNSSNGKDLTGQDFTDLLASLVGSIYVQNSQLPQDQENLEGGSTFNELLNLEVLNNPLQNQASVLQEMLITNTQNKDIANSSEIKNLLNNFEALLNSKAQLPEEIVKLINSLGVPEFEIPKHSIIPKRENPDIIITNGENVENLLIDIKQTNTSLYSLYEDSQLLKGGSLNNIDDSNQKELESKAFPKILPELQKQASEVQNIEMDLGNTKETPKNNMSLLAVDANINHNTEESNLDFNELLNAQNNKSSKEVKVTQENPLLGAINSSESLVGTESKLLEIDPKQLLKETVLIEKQQDLLDVTVQKFKTLRLPGLTEVTVKLKPENLGEVSLKLILEKGQISGNISADKNEVVNLLQTNLEQLKADLKNNNVNLSNITVNLYSSNNNNQNNRRGHEKKSGKPHMSNITQSFEDDVNSIETTEGINIIV